MWEAGPSPSGGAPLSIEWAYDRFGGTQVEVFRTILKNNLRVGLVSLAGAVTFGLATVTCLLLNGFAFGHLVGQHLAAGMDVGLLLKYTLPHSIELLGIWLSAGAGLRGAFLFVQWLRGNEPNVDSLTWLIAAAGFSVLIITVAAWIEVYITMAPFF